MKPKSSIAWRTDFLSFDMGDEKEDGEGFKFSETEYFDGEKISKQIGYNKDGDIILELYNKHDAKGRLVESFEKNYEDEVEEKTIFEYDGAGRLISEAQYYNDEFFEKTVNKYNVDGFLIEAATYDGDETQVIRQTREYNTQKQNTLIRHYEDGELFWEIKRIYGVGKEPVEELTTLFKEKSTQKTIHAYNEAGKRTKTEVFDGKGNLLHTTEDEYDVNGNLISQTDIDVGGSATHTIHTNVYDENNRLIETEIYDANNKFLSSKEIYAYNENGRVVEHEFYYNNAARGMHKTHFLLRIDWEMGE